jgi:hypothetical protein
MCLCPPALSPYCPTVPAVPSPSPSPADVISSQPEVLTPGVVVPTDLPGSSPAPAAGAALVAPAAEVTPPAAVPPPVAVAPGEVLVQPVVQEPAAQQPLVVEALALVQPQVVLPVTQVGSQCVVIGGGVLQVDSFTAERYPPHQILWRYSKVQAPKFYCLLCG